MKVTTSSKYQKRAKAQLKKMIKNNNFEGLYIIAFEFNKIDLWDDATFTLKEVAEMLLKELNN